MFKLQIAPAVSWLLLMSGGVNAQTDARLILNEWNAVGTQKWIDNDNSSACEGAAGITCSDNEDTFFGRVMGNGNDWIELVVVEDFLDIRGWQIRWAEPDEDDADGTDIWTGDGTQPQGIITFTDDPIWLGLRAGTIITLIERPTTPLSTGTVGLDTDLSFDPCGGDFWINVNAQDVQYVTCVSNIVPTEQDFANDPFEVGNDDWFADILDSSGVEAYPPTGEGAASWSGGGVSSREIARLEADPSPSINPFVALYDDGDASTFGSPNKWRDDFFDCRLYQDFSALRDPVRAEYCPDCLPIVLNEYNAVDSKTYLDGGTEGSDENGGLASDSYFGRVLGNGGNWFEMVVIENGLDIRGWTFEWTEVKDGFTGTILLSQDPGLSGLPAGTIVTFIESLVPTDLEASDGWINIDVTDGAIATTTSSNPDHGPGDMTTSNDDWTIAVYDDSLVRRLAPAGEGSSAYYAGGVGSTNVCRLRADPGPTTAADAFYDDSNSSTFGSLNTWSECPNESIILIQDTDSLPIVGCGEADDVDDCPADFDGDGQVTGADLTILLGSWGEPDADISGDGITSGPDLTILLGSWGVCSK